MDHPWIIRFNKCHFFSFVLVGRISFHCLEYSNEIQLKRQIRKKKKKKQRNNKSRNFIEAFKLRIKSEITIIIIAVDKGNVLSVYKRLENKNR